MFKSKKNLILNGVDIAQHFDDGDSFFLVLNIKGRSYVPTSRDIIRVPNRAGGISKSLQYEPRVLEVGYIIRSDTWESLRKKVEELNQLIYKDEIVSIQFADEMDRTYYGKFGSAIEIKEKTIVHEGTLRIVCDDPYKYGLEKTVNDLTVQNNGTVETPFIAEMEITEQSTFLSIDNGEKTLMIGTPNSTGRYEEYLKFDDPLNSTTGWNPITGLFTDYTQAGQITASVTGPYYYGAYFDLINVTFEGSWGGRSIVKSVGTTPDYRAEAVFEVARAFRPDATVRDYVVLVDGAGNEVARIGVLSDGNAQQIKFHARIGNDADYYELIDHQNTYSPFMDALFFKMIVEKKGNRYRASVIIADKVSGVEIKEEITAFYIDVLNKFNAEMSAVAIHMAQKYERQHYIYDIKVYEYIDEAAINPNIVKEGDVVTFDMENRQIFINGAFRNTFKNINSDFFNLKTGSNTITISPNITTNHQLTFRERYL